VATEKNLRERKVHEDRKLLNLTLLGAVTTSARPTLLYAATRENSDAKIRNVNAIAATILSQSRVVFLSKILSLLRCLDPRLAELCYIDTVRGIKGGGRIGLWWTVVLQDSVIITHHYEVLADNVRPEMREAFEAANLMEVPNSDREQSGVFKIESVHLEAYLRGIKTYHLDGGVVRVKAVPRWVPVTKTTAQIRQVSDCTFFASPQEEPRPGAEGGVRDGARGHRGRAQHRAEADAWHGDRKVRAMRVADPFVSDLPAL
jgi:hypothetical protein